MLPLVAFKPWCTSCLKLTVEQCLKMTSDLAFEKACRELKASLTATTHLSSQSYLMSIADTPPTLSAALALLPDLITPLGVNKSRMAMAVAARITPTLHPDPIPPHPNTPISISRDFLLAPANSQATNHAPQACLLHADPSVFDVLNIFWKHWFLLWDHLMKNIMCAQ
jgi:hypothetical protein